jgi:hypothetical protein
MLETASASPWIKAGYAQLKARGLANEWIRWHRGWYNVNIAGFTTGKADVDVVAECLAP